MGFSKAILPLATLLLTAQLTAAKKTFGLVQGDLDFVDAPPMDAEMSAWLASKVSKTGTKHATKTAAKAPARRTVDTEPEVSAFVKAVESVYGELVASESPVSLIQPTVVAVPSDVPSAEPTASEEDETSYARSGEEPTYDEDSAMELVDEESTGLAARDPELVSVSSNRANPRVGADGKITPKPRIVDEDKRGLPLPNNPTKLPSPDQVAEGEKAWWEIAKSNIGLAARDEEGDKKKKSQANAGRPHGFKYGRSISKSRITIEDADTFQEGPFQDVSGDPGDGSWAKRDKSSGPGGYGGSGRKGAGEGEGAGEGKKGAGERKGPGGKFGSGSGSGSGYGMKRGVPMNGHFNGTATDRPERLAAAPSGVMPGAAKPTGVAWWLWANGGRGGKDGAKPTFTPTPTTTI